MPSITDEKPASVYFKNHVLACKTTIGRPKGSKNRIGVNVRQSIERVFGALGDWNGMLAWARDNPDAFYGQVLPKLLPHELAESGAGQQIRVIVYGQTPSSPTNIIDLNTTSGSGQPSVSDGEEAQAIDNIAMSDHAPNLGPR